jgi:hypothetical protein
MRENMDNELKKAYVAPEVNAYGAVEELTRQGGAPNSDVFHGVDGTGYSAYPARNLR